MKHIITIALLLQTAITFAQQKVVMFYTPQWENIQMSDERALYYRKASVTNIENPVFDGKVEDMFVLGQKKHMTGFYKAGKKHGAFEFFHDNGKLAKKGYYKNDQKYGNWTYWYPNGQKKQVIRYTATGFSVIEYYNDEGAQMIKEGTGVWISRVYHQLKLIGVVRGLFQNGQRFGIWKYYSTHNLKTPLFKELYEGGKRKQKVEVLIVPKYPFNEFEPGGKFNKIDQWVVAQPIKPIGKTKRRRKRKKAATTAKPAIYTADELAKTPNILLDIEQVPVDPNDETICKKPDQYAKPVTGIRNLYHYIGRNLRYPTQARRKGIQGTVKVSFIVEKDGNIGNVNISKSIGESCDQEALRVVKGFPRFIPAVHEGKRVRVKMTLPITFDMRTKRLR
jgi:TonB family protein